MENDSNTAKEIRLFDESRMFYVLKEKYWDWGTGPILDEKGNEIGKIQRKIFSIRKKIDIQEMDDSIVCSIENKIIAIKPTYTLKDPMGNNIARLKKTFFSFLRPKFYLEDPEGNKLMEARGKFMGFNFNILNMSGNLLALIEKADKWRDQFLNGLLDFKDTYVVKIENENVDRKLLIGFVIAIDNSLHDSSGSNPRGIIKL